MRILAILFSAGSRLHRKHREHVGAAALSSAVTALARWRIAARRAGAASPAAADAATPSPAAAADAATSRESAVTFSRDDKPADAVAPWTSFAEAADALGEKVATKLQRRFAGPTTVQAHAWPAAAGGGDVVALAKTGSGKTLAYLLPAVANACRAGGAGVKVVVLAPTRELAQQIGADAAEWAPELQTALIYGGADRAKQIRQAKKASCLVATPGRLKDLVDAKAANLGNVKVAVLDEADRMLDMGFEKELTAIHGAMARPSRQTLFFSATWPRAVRRLARTYSRGPPLILSIDGAAADDGLKANAAVAQRFLALDDSEKDAALAEVINEMGDDDRLICFANTKRRVDYLAKALWADGFGCSAIHGGRTQSEREEALLKFKTHEWPLMIATDVAARGLDLPDVTHVVNFDMPRDVEQYVHRIGRTGRAGKAGHAITFWNAAYDLECAAALAKISRDAGQPVPDWLDAHAKKGKASKQWRV